MREPVPRGSTYRGGLTVSTRRGFISTGAASLLFSHNPSRAALYGASLLPFDQKANTNSQKTVIAHWHFFPISIDNAPAQVDYYSKHYLIPEGEGGKYLYCGGFVRERPFPRASISSDDWAVQDFASDIELAGAIGIDVFQYNISSLKEDSASWQSLTKFLRACRQAQYRMRIMPCIDCVSVDPEGIERQLTSSLLSTIHSDYLFRDPQGRIVISFFLPDRIDSTHWTSIAKHLRHAFEDIRFYFIFLDWNTALSRRDILDLGSYVSVWGGNHIASLEGLEAAARDAKGRGLNWVAPIWSQDFRPKAKSFVECHNSELFRASWRQVIRSDHDFVNLLTWNDYSEGSELRPSTSIRYSFYDLASYFIQWLKTGAAPPIVRDMLYYFHRVNIIGETELRRQDAPFQPPFGPPPSNDIEVVAFLTSAGSVEIETGMTAVTFEAAAGISAFRTPARVGRPNFCLRKNGEKIIDLLSDFEILGTSDYQDLLYHGGSSGRHSG